MTNSEGFLKGTAKDYDMTVEQVKLITKDCESASEFYDALELAVTHRSKECKQ